VSVYQPPLQNQRRKPRGKRTCWEHRGLLPGGGRDDPHHLRGHHLSHHHHLQEDQAEDGVDLRFLDGGVLFAESTNSIYYCMCGLY